MDPAEIQEIINEIQSLRIRLENTEEKLKKFYQLSKSKSTLEINTIVKITNKVTVYNKIQKRTKTDTIGKVIAFTDKFVRVEFEKNQFFKHQKGKTSVLRKAKFLEILQ